jgi:hypothetical protein
LRLNRNRLAISAAIVGAIAYPTWAGSWRAFPRAISAYDAARWRQAEDSFFAANNTTRSVYMKDQGNQCQEYLNGDRYKNDLIEARKKQSGFFFVDPSQQFLPCILNGVVSVQEISLSSYYSGLSAVLAVLRPWFLDIFVGALAGIFLVIVGPRLIPLIQVPLYVVSEAGRA